jgi:uncharacterized protein (TIGR02996 family)
MPDDTALLAAIRAAPDDDAPRLVYADWLDEHGDGARAEFIRVQCELARRESADLRARESALLDRHHDSFAGRLARPWIRYRFRRGFVVAFGHTGVFARDRRGSLSGAYSHFQFRMDGRWASGVGLETAEQFADVLRARPDIAYRDELGPYVLDPFDDPAAIRFHWPTTIHPSTWSGTFDGEVFLLNVNNLDTNEHRLKRYVHTPVDGFDSFTDPPV